MGQTLYLPHIISNRRRNLQFAHLFGVRPILCTCLIAMSGCQANKPFQTDLPIPAATLDTSQLQTVRYQSPQPISKTPPGTYLPGVGAMMAPGENEETIDQSNVVTDIIIRGNRYLTTQQLSSSLSTRPGRYFDPDKLQQDVDKIWRLPEVSRVNGPYISRSEQGVVITFDIVERDLIRELEFLGNRGISDRALKKATDLEVGNPLDVNEIRMAKARIEDVYKKKGYPRTEVEILEGNESGDAKVSFLIYEDVKQRIWKAEFEGNEIASDARLRHFIKGKPGIMKLFGGLANREEIDQDILRITNYYRSLGFFNARVGREISESNDGRWLNIRFIVDEGPRYRVRDVRFIGNGVYTQDQLAGMLELKPGNEGPPEFNSAKMNQDVVTLRDLYGSEGFVFAKVEAEPRFLEEPGLLDLVYKIDEGEQYRVGQINVHFEGDYGITKREVVLNRLSLRPGDKIDAREIRNSERRLGAAQVFAAGGTPGAQPPKIVVRPPELGGGSGTSFR